MILISSHSTIVTIILTIVALFGLSFIIYFTIAQKNQFVYYLFLFKPFIDTTVEIRYFSLSALDITGIYLFIFLLINFFTSSRNKDILNNNKIVLFLVLHVLAAFYFNFNDSDAKLIDSVITLIKMVDAFLIYYFASTYMRDYSNRIKIYKIIWISLLILGIIYLITIITDNSRKVYGSVDTYLRYSGLYNDPGTPSYQAVYSLLFGSLYLKLQTLQGIKISMKMKYLYRFTWIITLVIMWFALTKSAILMLVVFLILKHFQLKKYNVVFIIPFIMFLFIIAYNYSTMLQNRFSNEQIFIEQRSFDSAGSVGSGRVNRWLTIMDVYLTEYTVYEKIFGTFKTYGAHNQYLAFLTSIGIFGVTIFLLICISFYRRLRFIYRRCRSIEYYYTIMLLFIILIYSITGHPFYYTTLLWYLMLMLALSNIHIMPIIKTKSKSVRNISDNQINTIRTTF